MEMVQTLIKQFVAWAKNGHLIQFPLENSNFLPLDFCSSQKATDMMTSWSLYFPLCSWFFYVLLCSKNSFLWFTAFSKNPQPNFCIKMHVMQHNTPSAIIPFLLCSFVCNETILHKKILFFPRENSTRMLRCARLKPEWTKSNKRSVGENPASHASLSCSCCDCCDPARRVTSWDTKYSDYDFKAFMNKLLGNFDHDLVIRVDETAEIF